ncbi:MULTISPECIES: hypothetical protein [Brevibacillus]|uniref:DUF5659 domain-containing protein n=1 Tax=Brevibacillus brevis TaxID=1393 RepID=A0ABY9T7C5_BREBE|nr:hypothetical protein [Brevibacillus brevis]WNC15389.1 hypothetical protein RGB73_03275 [Brevibacillus brevis]
MTKRLYFFVSLSDALRISQELSQFGVTRYHVQPHETGVAFVFERVSDVTQIVLRHLFGTDGESKQD